MKNKKIVIGILAFFILGLGYYLTEYRPQQLRMKCWELSKDAEDTEMTLDSSQGGLKTTYESLGRGSGATKAYDDCLQTQGISRYSVWENLNLF